jgi:hypothetical protein
MASELDRRGFIAGGIASLAAALIGKPPVPFSTQEFISAFDKTLIGVTHVPIVFDDAYIVGPLLHGELHPFVARPIEMDF